MAGRRRAAADPSVRSGQAVLPPQTERSFQAQVVQAAKVLGWRTYHTWLSMHSAGGFPDLVLVRRPRVIFAELKAEGRYPTREQQDWLADLTGCNVEVYLWRPSMWDEIERMLR